MVDETEKTAREIMDDEAQTAGDEPQHNDGLTQEERQARFEEALAQAEEMNRRQQAAETARVRSEYRQFVAGQVYPALVNKAPVHADVQEIADNAVFLANQLIAALDRADALDGAAETAQ